MSSDNWANNDYDHSTLKNIFDWTATLPYAMQLNFEAGPSIGLVHGGITKGTHWQTIKEDLLAPKEPRQLAELKAVLAWDRKVIKSMSEHVVEGVDVLLHGHTVVKRAVTMGNRVYFDTGAFFSAERREFALTILKYNRDCTGTQGNGWFDEFRFRLKGKKLIVNK